MDKKQIKINIYKILCIILMIILIVVLTIWGYTSLVEKSAVDKYEKLQQNVNSGKNNTTVINQDTQNVETQNLEQEGQSNDTKTEQTDYEKYNIPYKNIDWDELKEVNPDIYAWIYIPNTNIDYPILQKTGNNDYYLNHNLDGTWGKPGCIYTEDLNSRAFTDYNTVIYGHNMKSGTMFRTLHNFEDYDFFNNNQYVYIYTRDKVFVYQIFAAYTNDAKHILNTNDFSSEEGLSNYLDTVLAKAGQDGYLNNNVKVTGKNAIITLSTCTKSSDKRYLVQAVLVNE